MRPLTASNRLTTTQRQDIQYCIAVPLARSHSLARHKLEDKDTAAGRLNVRYSADVDQQRALDANEPNGTQKRVKPLDRIARDVFRAPGTKPYVIAGRLYAVHSAWIERIQPARAFTYKH
jgi:hypothetical protein